MKVIKLLGRIIVVIMMIPTVLQLFLCVIGLVATFRGTGNSIAFMLGKTVGTLLILMLLKWIFSALGEDRSK